MNGMHEKNSIRNNISNKDHIPELISKKAKKMMLAKFCLSISIFSNICMTDGYQPE